VWLDAHGDFNTPESSTSGFFDGMGLATVAGRCWSALAASVPGFAPVAERDILLVGARDLDPAEAALLAGSAVQRVAVEVIRTHGAAAALAPALDAVAPRGRRAYLHIDLDVLDPSAARANEFAAPGGLTIAEVADVVRAVGARCRISAAALTAYDPAPDEGDRALGAALELIGEMVEAASKAAAPDTVAG
jgi:arginase